jgi:hypothetical protein
MNAKLLNLIGVVGLAVGLLAATPAHAMPGKHSGRRASRGYHGATAVGTGPVGPVAHPSYRGYYGGGYYGAYVGVGPRPYFYYPWYASYPWYAVGPTSAVVVSQGVVNPYPDRRDVYEYQEEKRADPFEIYRFELGATAQPLSNGSGIFGLNLLVDWRSLGIDVRFDDVGIRPDSLSSVDHSRLLNASMTFPLIDGEHGRLRAHLGAYSLFVPGTTFVGPGGGLSLSLDLFGPFTAEGSAQAVLFPFTQLDSRAAMGLRLGPIEGRLGWRFLLLDDQGRSGDVGNVNVASGPYLGALIRI